MEYAHPRIKARPRTQPAFPLFFRQWHENHEAPSKQDDGEGIMRARYAAAVSREKSDPGKQRGSPGEVFDSARERYGIIRLWRTIKHSAKGIPIIHGWPVAFVRVAQQWSKRRSEKQREGYEGWREKERGNLKNRNWSPSGLTRIPSRHIHRSLPIQNKPWAKLQSIRKNLHISSSGETFLHHSNRVP